VRHASDLSFTKDALFKEKKRLYSGLTKKSLLKFMHMHLSFSHAFCWSTTNHCSLTFFTTRTGLTEFSCLEGIILSQSIMEKLLALVDQPATILCTGVLFVATTFICKRLWDDATTSTNLTRFVLWTGRQIANFFLPGSGIVITIVVACVSRPQRAEAAGPSDCWTGEPDERLLRAMDKKLSRITEEQNALAERAVEKGALFGMGLPGSPAEQKKDISTILENHLDTLDVDKRLRELRRWAKEEELGSPESSFWLMVVEEITKC